MRSARFSLLCIVAAALWSAAPAYAQDDEVIDLNLEGQGSGSIVVEETKKPDAPNPADGVKATTEAIETEAGHPCTDLFPASLFGGLSMVEGSAKLKTSKKGTSCKLSMTASETTLAELMASIKDRMEADSFDVSLSKKNDKIKATRSTDERMDALELKAKANKGGEVVVAIQWSAAVFTKPK